MKFIPLNDGNGKVITVRKEKDKILSLCGAFHKRILLMLMRPCSIIVISNFFMEDEVRLSRDAWHKVIVLRAKVELGQQFGSPELWSFKPAIKSS